MNHVDKRRSGFTVIELVLAMSFVSILMIAIAATVIQLTNMYNKGTTLRAVDQAGRAISRELQTTLAASYMLDVNSHTPSRDFRPQVRPDGGDVNNPDGGRLCTGTYSYVWNNGHSLASAAPVNRYDGDEAEIRLVKVYDAGKVYCNDPMPSVAKDGAVELLSAGDRDLAIQSFRITREAYDSTTQQGLYRIVLEIGTNDKGSLDQQANINTIDTTCKPPSDDASQRDFCAVNQFEFTVRTGNRRES